MKLNKFNLALASILTLSATASSAAQTYLNLGVSALQYQDKSSSVTATSDSLAIGGTLGVDLTPHLGVEALLATGLNSGDVKIKGVSGINGDLSLDYAAGIYGVIRTRKNNTASAYIKAGYTQVKGSGKASYGSTVTTYKTDDTSFSYGIGVDFIAHKDSAIRFEYMSYYDKNNTTLNGFSIGYKMPLSY